MRDPGLDGDFISTADLQKNEDGIDASNNILSKDSYSVTIENLPVKLVGKYNFVFNYYYKNPDETQSTPLLGPPSATYSIELTIPDLSEAPTNVVAVGGVSSYTVSWDKPTFKTYGDTIVYESDTNSFNSSSKVVFVGTDTQCSVITSDYNNKWVYVVHRDIFREAHKKGTVAGPITIKTADPDTTFTVANPGSTSASASIDPSDLSGFSLVSTISWAQSTDTKTAGYAIRWSTNDPSVVPTPLWEYASVSGRSTTSFTATGLIPNTTYYYQVASTTPYDVVNWTGAASGTFIASDADGTAAGALARLKSYIAIGGASQDLFKIGTGISQGINLNTEPLTTPSLTSGTYHGIILNKSTTNVGNNFWLTTGQFRVGNPTEFMYWNGANLYLTGNINATGGKFTGNVQLAIPAGATTSGVLYAGASPTSGTRVRFNSEGIFGYDANGETFKLQSSDGLMTASKGQIAQWTIDGTKLTKNNARLDSTGVIELGVSNTDNIIRLDANDPTYRLWIGRNSSSTAPFRVTKEGALIASGVTINGNSTFYGTLTVGTQLSDGTTIDTVKTNALQGITDAGAAASQAAIAKARGDEAYNAAIAAGQSATAAANAAQAASDAVALKMSASDINTVLDLNTTVINGSRVTTGTIDVARLNISGGSAGFNGFVVDGNGIRATNGGYQTLNISSTGTISLGDSTNGWTVDNQYIKSRSYYTTGYTELILDGWNGSITGRRISGTTIEGNTIKGNTITGGTITGSVVQTSTSSTNVKLQNSGIDSLEVTLSGTTVGHIYGVLAGGTTSAIIMQGGSADPSSTASVYPRAYIGSSVISIGADASTSILLNSVDNTTKLFGSGGIYTDTVGSFYMRSGDTTAAVANMQIVSTAGTTFGKVARSTSSRRYKTDIEEISYPNESVKLLRPVKYHGIKDMERGDNTWYTGLIAEEVAEIPGLELLVTYDDEGQPDAVNYAGLSVVLAQVVSRILDRLDALES